jgi:hypothetical protein
MVSSAVERYALCDAGEQLVCMLVQAASSILFNTNSNTGSPCGATKTPAAICEL